MERTSPDTIPIGVWLKERDFESKLRAALEQIFTGQGWAIFDGLQVTGEVNLKLFFDGAAVTLHKLERLMPEPITIIGEKGHGMDEPFMGGAVKAGDPLMSSISTETPITEPNTGGLREGIKVESTEVEAEKPSKRKRKERGASLAPNEEDL